MIKAVFLMCCMGMGITAACQEFGGNPPSIKWRQVNLEAARVIYPEGLDSVAISVAGIVDRLSRTTTASIGSRQQKVSIVLQQETTISNAYVQLAPFRSEFYLTPPQNSFSIGSLPWPGQLAIHEFRHVQQNNNFNVGVSRLFRLVFGQEGQALANNLAIPDWFYEGDAVYNETNVSPQGRGRLPFFYNEFRSLWDAGKQYSWMKLRNGSLRDLTPNNYRLGYLMVAYGREKYGTGFWKKVTHDAAAYHGVVYPFQQAVKRYSGKNYSTFRNDALRYYQSQKTAATSGTHPGHHHFVSNEVFPAFINDTAVIFQRSSYRKLPVFIVRSGQKEKLIRIRDVSTDNQFSYRNGRIVYASFRPDVRWGWRNYNELQLLDVHSGRQRTLTTRSKYFAPDISPDGASIVAVRVVPGGTSFLDIINAGNGKVIRAVPNPEQLFYTYPKFYDSGKLVSAVRNTRGEMSLALIDATSGAATYLTSFSFNTIGFPSIRNDTVLFTASYQGNDHLFAYVMGAATLYSIRHPLLSGITGSYQPVMGSRSVVWSQFTADGYQLQQAVANELEWQQVSPSALAAALTNFGITSVDNNPAGPFSPPAHVRTEKYAKSFRLINFHSWEPLANEPDYTLTLVGENVLNTLRTQLFTTFNRDEHYQQVGFNAIYGAWFPYVSGGYQYTFGRSGFYHNRLINWNEWEARLGASLPLNLSKGRHLTSLNVGADYVYNQAGFRGAYKDSIHNTAFGYISSTLSFTNQVQQARQQIFPRFAQTLLFNSRHSVSSLKADQWLLSGSLYLPALSVTHSLVLTGALQQRDTLNGHRFTNNFPFARGYTAENYHRMINGGVNYHFPLWYPDAGFAGIVYFLRVRANLYYDQTHVSDFLRNGKPATADFRSAGTEIFFDTKWWNELPVSFGFRYSYLLDRDVYGSSMPHRFEFILPVNLLQR